MKVLNLKCFVVALLAIMLSSYASPKNKSTSTKYINDAPRNRHLTISGVKVSESDFGGVERWYMVDMYNYGKDAHKVRFQVGYFKKNKIGFILYEGGREGEIAQYSRRGLDLRWDWEDYTILIKPDGTCLYYDFSTSKDGTAKPRDIYKASKF